MQRSNSDYHFLPLLPITFQKFRSIVSIQRSREEIALRKFAMKRLQACQLTLRLHAFRDHVHTQIPSERRDGSDDFDVFVFLFNSIDEGTINLESVYREPMQIAQRRIASAKIINAQMDIQIRE